MEYNYLMPFTISKGKKGFVVKKKDGKVVAGNKTPLSKDRAIKVMIAIENNSDE
jgi:hypothetical protein